MDIAKVEDRTLVPLGGALIQGDGMKYRIELVASKKYGSRPFKRFTSDQVSVDAKNGILRFTTRALEIQQFVWELVWIHTGKGSPTGEHVDVYVDATNKDYPIATATLTGYITACNNLGPERGFVIEVQANSEIKVEYHE